MERYLRLAMAQAEEAAAGGNRPFGAVIVEPDGTVAIAERNRTIERSDPTSHAETNAIRELCVRRGTLGLDGFTLYANARPCPMCFTLMVAVRIEALVYGAPGDPASWPVSMDEFAANARHRIRIEPGILADEAAAQMARLEGAR